MTSPICFKGTYIFPLSGNSGDKFHKMFDYINKNNSNLQFGYADLDKFDNGCYIGKEKVLNVITSKELDFPIESYCLQNGISFTKISDISLIEPLTTLLNTVPSKDKKILTFIDIFQFEKLIKSQRTNVYACYEQYSNLHRSRVLGMIKYSDDIQAPTLEITPNNMSSKEALDILDGSKKLQDDFLTVAFTSKSLNPDYELYFGYRELGLTKIPVFVDKNTHDIGLKLGIFKDLPNFKDM